MWRPRTSSFWMRPIMLAVAPAALVRMAECADWVLDARGHYLRMPVHLICVCPYTCFSLISSARPLEANKIKTAPTAFCP